MALLRKLDVVPSRALFIVFLLSALVVTGSQAPQQAEATAEAIPGSTADTLRIAVGAGNFHACAIDSNNGVKCWGTSASYYNDWGQLGQGNTNAYTGPQTVLTLSSGVKQIAVGNTHACAVLSTDGSVLCWGRNQSGALGNGAASTGGASATPTNVITTTNANLTGVSDIASFDDHTCAVKSGAVFCWGYNIGGMGITGNTNDTLLKATQVLASGAVSVAVGNDSSCAIMTDATVKCWGTGGKGQMGNAGALSYNNPATTVSGLTDVVALSVGLGTACALRSNGNIHCWGNNLFGVVGNGICGFGSGSGEMSATPVGPINSYIGVTNSEQVVAISLSYSEGIALTDTGRTIKWGGGTGPCRAGSTWQQSLPAGITVVGISASGTGLAQSCYVRSDAAVICNSATATGVTPSGAAAPSVPGTPTAIGGNGQATITITPAQSGPTPSSYTVTANPGGATCTVTPPATSCAVTGLTNGTTYTFTSTATNTFGTSAASAASNSITPLAPPDAPGAPTAIGGNGQATITVTPAQTGGTPSSYTVTANPGGATCTITPPATSCTITGLTNGTAYTFTSTATNASGTSAASAASNSITPLAPPDAPGAPTATVNNGVVTVTITPAQTGGTPTSYTVTANPGGATCTITSPATSCTITGLTNGTAYTFTSTATNASGTSAVSSQSKSHMLVAASNSTSSSPSSNADTPKSSQTQNGQSALTSNATASTGGSSSTGSTAKTMPTTGTTGNVFDLACQLIVCGLVLLLATRRFKNLNLKNP